MYIYMWGCSVGAFRREIGVGHWGSFRMDDCRRRGWGLSHFRCNSIPNINHAFYLKANNRSNVNINTDTVLLHERTYSHTPWYLLIILDIGDITKLYHCCQAWYRYNICPNCVIFYRESITLPQIYRWNSRHDSVLKWRRINMYRIV